MVDDATIKADETGKISVPMATGAVAGLISASDFSKIQGIQAEAQKNLFQSVNESEFEIDDEQKLNLLAIPQEKITGFDDVLKSKVDVETGKSLVENTLITKLEGVEEGAQANKLEAVKVNGVALDIADKAVNIPVGGTVLGVVMSSDAQNKVAIGADGTMEVNNVNVSKLVQDNDSYLILDGGTSI